MFIRETIGNRDILHVPPVVAALSPSHEENGRSPWVESVQNAVRFTGMLYPELAHVSMT